MTTALYLLGIAGGAVALAAGVLIAAIPFVVLALGAYAKAHERDLAAKAAGTL